MVITTKTLLPTPAVQPVVDPQGPSMGYGGAPACLKCGFVIAHNLLFWNTRLCLEILGSLVFFKSCESFLPVLKGSGLLCIFMEMLPWHRRGAMWVVLLVTVSVMRAGRANGLSVSADSLLIWDVQMLLCGKLVYPLRLLYHLQTKWRHRLLDGEADSWLWTLLCEMVPGELCLPFQRCS